MSILVYILQSILLLLLSKWSGLLIVHSSLIGSTVSSLIFWIQLSDVYSYFTHPLSITLCCSFKAVWWNPVCKQSITSLSWCQTCTHYKKPNENQSTNESRVADKAVCDLLLQYQLNSPSTRCQSLVLCWWVAQRCCSGGVPAFSPAYCSETPGKQSIQEI